MLSLLWRTAGRDKLIAHTDAALGTSQQQGRAAHSILAVSEETLRFELLRFWFCSFDIEIQGLQPISDSVSDYTEWKALMFRIKTRSTGLQVKAGWSSVSVREV